MKPRNMIFILIFFIIAMSFPLARTTADPSSPFPSVTYPQTRRMLQCLYPRFNALHVPATLLKQSQIHRMDLHNIRTHRWSLLPPTYRLSYLYARNKVRTHQPYIPDAPLEHLYSLWYYYVYDLMYRYLDQKYDWDDEYIKIIDAVATTEILRPCLLKEQTWEFLFDKLFFDSDETLHLKYKGLLTYAISELYKHPDINTFINKARAWYHRPQQLKSLPKRMKSIYQALRHQYLQDVFQAKQIVPQSIETVSVLTAPITLHRNRSLTHEPGHNHQRHTSQNQSTSPSDISMVIGLPGGASTYLPVRGDTEMTFEMLQPVLDELTASPPDFWGDADMADTLPPSLFNRLIDDLKSHHIQPIRCNDDDPRTIPWMTFQIHGYQITLTHVAAPPLTGYVHVFVPFREIPRAMRPPGSNRVSCIASAVRTTHPDHLIVTGYLYASELARLMSLIPKNVRVLYFGKLPAIFYPDLSDDRSFNQAFHLRNWTFVNVPHLGVHIQKPHLKLVQLPSS